MADDMKWSLADYDALPGTAHAMPSTQTATPGRLARPTTAADRPSVTDDARAAVRGAAMDLYCALRRANPDAYAEVEDVEDWAYWEDIVRTAQVTLAAGRAETTTATTEDAARVIYDSLHTLNDPTFDELGGATRDDYILAAEALAEDGLLATARTRPTREQIARAILIVRLAERGIPAEHVDDPDLLDTVTPMADAVLALLADQPDPADIAAKARADLLAYLIDNFNRQHALVALDTPEEGYSGLSWHEWADGTRNGMEKLIYTVRYLAEHPEYAERAARLRGGAS